MSDREHPQPDEDYTDDDYIDDDWLMDVDPYPNGDDSLRAECRHPEEKEEYPVDDDITRGSL